MLTESNFLALVFFYFFSNEVFLVGKGAPLVNINDLYCPLSDSLVVPPLWFSNVNSGDAFPFN
jgi:hypothetical protein